MTLFLLSFSCFAAYLLSLTPLTYFLPQFIAFLSVGFFILTKKKMSVIYLVSFIVNLIVFSQNGVHSPFFFLVYFLLFIVAFQFSPPISLTFSLFTAIILAQSTNSVASLLPIASLLFISPIVWLISQQSLSNQSNQKLIALEETDFLLWHNLKFKTGITNIIDLASQLVSTPLSFSQKEQIKKIRISAKSLLNSSEKLTKEISDED